MVGTIQGAIFDGTIVANERLSTLATAITVTNAMVLTRMIFVTR